MKTGRLPIKRSPEVVAVEESARVNSCAICQICRARIGSSLLTIKPAVLIPILVYCEGELDLLARHAAAGKRPRQATAHTGIANAIAGARDICIRTVPPKRAASRANADCRPLSPDSAARTLHLVVTAHR